MKKLILTLGMVLALVAVMVVPTVVLASNEGTQSASTSQATSINIVSKPDLSTAAVTTITFPAGAPNAIISAPYNDVDTSDDPQFLDGSASEPVVQLHNTSAGTLNVVIQVGAWGEAVVSSERYELVATTVVNQATVAAVLSSDGGADTVVTGIPMTTETYKDLYLEVTLSALYGAEGTSTLTILGES